MRRLVTVTVIAVMFVLVFFLSACSSYPEYKDIVNINNIESDIYISNFRYSEGGSMSEGSFQIVTDSNGDVIINYLDFGLSYPPGGSNDVCIQLSMSKYNELTQIIEEYDLVSWDGFGKGRNIMYVDGGGFSLEILWNDGASISAKSQYPYPDNFEEVDSAIKGFFNYYLDDWKKANNIE